MEIEKKVCKVEFKKKGKKILLSMNGYCDDNQPDKILNKNIEFADFDKLEEVI
ncbi:MAG: hypothetical protein AABY22_23380 [Nanoarchaeota archaeon]